MINNLEDHSSKIATWWWSHRSCDLDLVKEPESGNVNFVCVDHEEVSP